MHLDFSIITPSFRQPEWLKRCHASIVDQQGVTLEHVVQDAGTGPVLEEWAAQQTDLRLFVEKDEGMYDAVNRGLRRANGEICAYLNCDEQYLPGTLARVREFFRKNPTVDVCFGDVVIVDEEGNYICSREMVPPQLPHVRVNTLPVFTAATFFRSRLLTEKGLYFDTRWKDVGDSAWVRQLLSLRVKTGCLHAYTTTFADTGENMNLKPNAIAERERIRNEAPAFLRALAPALRAHYRLRRMIAGQYSPKPFSYEIYSGSDLTQRRKFDVPNPTPLWKSRLNLPL